MERRLVLFLLFSVGILLANAYLQRWLNPPKPRPVAQQAAGGKDAAKAPAEKAAEAKAAEAGGQTADGQAADGQAAGGAASVEQAGVEAAPAAGAADQAPPARPRHPLRWITIGSLDPKSPYRMLVTLVSRGATCARIELNDPTYRDSEFDGPYLGQLELTNAKGAGGALVGVVGAGTPAAEAGLQAGDVIRAIGDREVLDRHGVDAALGRLRPGDTVVVQIERGGQTAKLEARLSRKPVDVVRPEYADPLTCELTLAQLDEEKLAGDKTDLPGEPMSRSSWELVNHDPQQATFRWVLEKNGLEVIKRFRMAKIAAAGQAAGGQVGGDKAGGGPGAAYHLVFDIEIRNTSDAAHRVAYRLGGPTGLPTEGWWYASKISRTWSGTGIRDVVVGTQVGTRPSIETVSGIKLAQDKEVTHWKEVPVLFAGVDAQYFAAILIPQKKTPDDIWFADLEPRRVGVVPTDKNRQKLANISFRATTLPGELKPREGMLAHSYLLFAGPKKPAILAEYGLDGIVYYGWFGAVSRAMLAVLHFFHDTLHLPFALAIILLTVCVRSAMFPLSRRQALSAQKMQELAPEMKKLAEKYKNNLEARSRAQQELFRKHNYNPLAGCLPMFIQLPIFIGLYRSLSVDVELRGAPLISAGLRWASNLAAPDQLFSWEAWMPAFAQSWLGPYFNVLPCVTIALFIWQQKMFMPPPTDEQAAMQYKMMQYMMIFMGILFFKVPSGLCVYFIASSLWGIAERKLLPKTIKKNEPGTAAMTTITVPSQPAAEATAGNGSGATASKKKQRGRK